MIRLLAPYPAPLATIALPDAEWGDVTRSESTMMLYRSMNNARKVTHVHKLTPNRTYEVSFLLARAKAQEYIIFYEMFGAEQMRIEFDKDTAYVGYLKVNPAELEFIKRAVTCGSLEEVQTKFEFETH